MQVVEMLHARSARALPAVHQYRRSAVWAGVEGVLRGGQLWLTHIGRSLDSETDEKHSIKRIDRLLGNAHVWRERAEWYRWIARWCVSSAHHPIVLVDWSNADGRNEHYLLRAALAVGSRAMPSHGIS